MIIRHSVCCVFLVIGIAFSSVLHASLITQTFGGYITSAPDNPMGFSTDSVVALTVSYDPGWISQKSYNSQSFNVINVIDYYGEGARLTLQIDSRLYLEMSTQNPVTSIDAGAWYNSQPFLVFDENGRLTGFEGQWLDEGGVAPGWDMDMFVNGDSLDFSIYFNDYVNGTAGYVCAPMDYANVPLPSAFMLMLSGIFGVFGIAQCKAELAP